MNAHLPVELRGLDHPAALAIAASLLMHRAEQFGRPGLDIVRAEPSPQAGPGGADFLAHVREETELSRSRLPAILQPVDTLYRAVDALGLAMRQAGPDMPSRCAVNQRAAELAALVVRLATEGTPVWPHTLPGGGR